MDIAIAEVATGCAGLEGDGLARVSYLESRGRCTAGVRACWGWLACGCCVFELCRPPSANKRKEGLYECFRVIKKGGAPWCGRVFTKYVSAGVVAAAVLAFVPSLCDVHARVRTNLRSRFHTRRPHAREVDSTSEKIEEGKRTVSLCATPGFPTPAPTLIPGTVPSLSICVLQPRGVGSVRIDEEGRGKEEARKRQE